MIVLGIETSCDDTSVGLVNDQGQILGHIILSQHGYHRVYQGVVPEIAARAHLEHLVPTIQACLAQANLTLNDVDAIAATTGPGLIGGVIVGTMLGKALAHSLKIPFMAINHLEAHVLSARLSNPDIAFPYLCLLMSGGHTQLVLAERVGSYQLLGNSLDDAVGECFDKVAKMLGLPYPGGPEIEKQAREGNPKAFPFPRPLLHEKNCHFSFSGLKTAVKYTLDKITDLTPELIQDVCASFQAAVADVVISRLGQAFQLARDKGHKIAYLTSGGGVAANGYLRAKMAEKAQAEAIQFDVPAKELCTDNGAMISWAGIERIRQGVNGDLTVKPRPRWPLNEVGL